MFKAVYQQRNRETLKYIIITENKLLRALSSYRALLLARAANELMT